METENKKEKETREENQKITSIINKIFEQLDNQGNERQNEGNDLNQKSNINVKQSDDNSHSIMNRR